MGFLTLPSEAFEENPPTGITTARYMRAKVEEPLNVIRINTQATVLLAACTEIELALRKPPSESDWDSLWLKLEDKIKAAVYQPLSWVPIEWHVEGPFQSNNGRTLDCSGWLWTAVQSAPVRTFP